MNPRIEITAIIVIVVIISTIVNQTKILVFRFLIEEVFIYIIFMKIYFNFYSATR